MSNNEEPDKLDGSEVTFGELVRIFEPKLLIAKTLLDDDRTRANNLLTLMTQSVLLPAFDSVMWHLVRIVKETPDSPLGKASEVGFSEVFRGFGAALNEDQLTLMNSCRVLMELTALVKEWRFVPEKMADWLSLEPKRRAEVFKFGNITDRLRNHLKIPPDMILKEKLEYTHHSQWVHAIPYDHEIQNPDFFLMLSEIIGHTEAFLREIAELRMANLEQVPEVPGIPPDGCPTPWLEAIEWRENYHRIMESSLNKQGLRINRSPAVPRGAGPESVIEPIENPNV